MSKSAHKADLADRKRASEAKKLLQTRQGLTQQQAYLHLQRATISEIACKILAAEDLGSRRIA